MEDEEDYYDEEEQNEIEEEKIYDLTPEEVEKQEHELQFWNKTKEFQEQ